MHGRSFHRFVDFVRYSVGVAEIATIQTQSEFAGARTLRCRFARLIEVRRRTKQPCRTLAEIATIAPAVL
jgi:hypothetical protein